MSVGEIASLATAVGVVLVALQLVLGRRQARVALEDELSREYREIATRIPVPAFFDKLDPELPLPDLHEHIREYVRYLDLSKQQVFLRMQRRISARTWQLWRDGIRDNLERDGFNRAWIYVRTHSTKSYDELGSLCADWASDPGWWNVPWWLFPVKKLRGSPDRPTAWRPTVSDGTSAS
jgi:hypothetical protein